MRLPRRVFVEEVLDLGRHASIAIHRIDSLSLRHFWHSHPELELVVMVRGSGSRHVGDSVERCGAGDVVLLGSGMPHSWGMEPSEAGRIDCIYAQWNGANLLAAARHLNELSVLGRLFERARHALVVEGEQAQAITALAIETHQNRQEPLARCAGLLRILSLLGDGSNLRTLCSPAYVAPSGPDDSRQARLQRFLHEHRTERVPAARAAAIAGVPASSFSRFFAGAFNRTYRAYCTDLKLVEACRLLAESERPVLEIALAAGFANLANFNRRFRQSRGLTPSAWRQAMREG